SDGNDEKRGRTGRLDRDRRRRVRRRRSVHDGNALNRSGSPVHVKRGPMAIAPTPDPQPKVPPMPPPPFPGQQPVKEPDPERLPDEDPLPNPDENDEPPQQAVPGTGGSDETQSRYNRRANAGRFGVGLSGRCTAGRNQSADQ